MRRRLGSLPLAILLVTALGACSSDDGDEGGAAVPRASTTTASTTSTTTAEQAYAIPDTIDAAYVNRVMTALNKVYGDVVRKQVESQRFVEEDLVPMRAIFSEDETFQVAQAFAESPIGPRSDYQDPIGDRAVIVEQVITARPSCIYFRGTYDASRVSKRSAPPKAGWVILRPKDSGADPLNLNPTPWMIAVEEFSEQPDQCAS